MSLIYRCPRSASVIANNYCSLAKFSEQDFKKINMKFPGFINEMKHQIWAYDDDIKIFLELNLKKISYLKNLPTDIFHEVLFNMHQETFVKGSYLINEKDKID